MKIQCSKGVRLARLAVTYSVLFGAVSAAWAQDTGYSMFGINIFGGYQRGRQTGDVKYFNVPSGTTLGWRDFGSGAVAGVRFTQDFHSYIGLEQSGTWSRLPSYYLAYSTGQYANINGDSWKATLNPVFHFTRRESKIRPFATAGITGNWFDPRKDNLLGNNVGPALKMRVWPAFMMGVGVKMHVNRRFGVRFDLRDNMSRPPHYTLPDFPSAPGAFYSPDSGRLHQIELSGGFIFRWGWREPPAPLPPPAPRVEAPPPPPEPKPAPPAFALTSITASPTSVCPGTPVEVRAETSDVPADATYRWTVNGSPISASGTTASVPTTGATGEQVVELTIESGGVTKSAKTTFSVKAAGNPTLSVTASPATVARGGSSTITPTAAASECGGTVQTSCTASEGTLSGLVFDSSSVAFDQNAIRAQSKNVTISCTATDSLGQTARATTQVTVTEQPRARRLDDVVYAKGSGRVNNCAKRLLLEELTPLLRDNPDSTVVLVGHRDEQETGRAAANLDRVRALNAAAVLSAGTGICPQLELSRVRVATVGTNQSTPTRPAFCGASTEIKERGGQAVTEADSRAQFRRVEIWFVPAGAQMPEGLGNAQPAPADAVKVLGCPK